MKKNKAFSLIEMLAVIAIVGVVFAISVPAFNSVTAKNKVSEGAKIIYKTLEFARHYAVSNNTDVIVMFDNVNSVGKMGFKIAAAGEGDIVPPIEIDIDSEIEDWMFLFNGVDIDTGNMGDTGNVGFLNDGNGDGDVWYVEMNATGTPADMGSITVTDKSGELSREIAYTSTSGEIKLKDFEG